MAPHTKRKRTAEATQNGPAAGGAAPFAKDLPAEMQAELARRYAELFHVYVKHRGDISRVTFGV